MTGVDRELLALGRVHAIAVAGPPDLRAFVAALRDSVDVGPGER